MKKIIICFLMFTISASTFSQQTNVAPQLSKQDYRKKNKALETQTNKTKIVGGISGPELLHVGITYRIANSSQLGLNVGAGPSLGTIWTSISLEHRLYLGKNNSRTDLKSWFFRQGTTFFPSAKPPQQFTLNLSVGKDLPFKNPKNGITIDAGVFYLPQSESSSIILIKSLCLWPALRFQLYFTL
ncbi:MAG: hypothetical protein ABIP79_06790 [Chitinophagaceae bacterium]